VDETPVFSSCGQVMGHLEVTCTQDSNARSTGNGFNEAVRGI
jgi:hypothetical protein